MKQDCGGAKVPKAPLAQTNCSQESLFCSLCLFYQLSPTDPSQGRLNFLFSLNIYFFSLAILEALCKGKINSRRLGTPGAARQRCSQQMRGLASRCGGDNGVQAGLALARGSCQANGGEGWEPFSSGNCQERMRKSQRWQVSSPGGVIAAISQRRGQFQTAATRAVLEAAQDACGSLSLSPLFPPFVSSLA